MALVFRATSEIYLNGRTYAAGERIDLPAEVLGRFVGERRVTLADEPDEAGDEAPTREPVRNAADKDPRVQQRRR